MYAKKKNSRVKLLTAKKKKICDNMQKYMLDSEIFINSQILLIFFILSQNRKKKKKNMLNSKKYQN